jgi:metal transporter CNNM
MLLIKLRAAETQEERDQAASLLPLVQQHHVLLVTLLLMNSVAGEALPMFLHVLVPEIIAVIISVVLVLIVGEILPSALFTGPGQLALASKLAPLVKAIICCLWPLVWPLAKLLDIMFSDHSESNSEGFNRHELAALIRIQHEGRLATKQRRAMERTELGESVDCFFAVAAQQQLIPTDQTQTTIRDLKKRHVRNVSLHIDEISMMEGALQMKTKVAADIFLSYRKVYAISMDTILNEANILSIYSSGYSRVPVHDPNDRTRIRGILMTRQLIVLNIQTDEIPVSNLFLYIPQCVPPDMNLVDLVNLFQTGGAAAANRAGHMALVCANPSIANAALEEDESIPNEAGLMG